VSAATSSPLIGGRKKKRPDLTAGTPVGEHYADVATIEAGSLCLMGEVSPCLRLVLIPNLVIRRYANTE
jgi:hypothetical protein